MSKEIKWRIIESKNGSYLVKRKVFGIWYSFDWNVFFTNFFILLFFIAASGFILGAILLLFKIHFLTSIGISAFSWTIFIILFNAISFKNYNDAENFIKEKLKRELGEHITEFIWDGEKISIEKKLKK